MHTITSAAPVAAKSCCITSIAIGVDTSSGAKYAPSSITDPNVNSIRLPHNRKPCPRERLKREAKGLIKAPSNIVPITSRTRLDVGVASANLDNPKRALIISAPKIPVI